ncbi:uncharacterized protein L969DRAFT_42923 [Mixia osmundae IAM 14324]|uniref:Uncharacterized protein n=1 Tax=Mixia osmundae (strain CBS 9802 / IAM 14324 / JCM 22182 / KY 12970) TaxID=764103 RepID=G7E549_MIXOS|nr:uncharacterized protein L969DRAFT_42923 [Mixia osmundae IAM 14324]KEI42684.1 hypothetical protein L969DRAFT_42923 [Mixia osmundae IAM 14324]GAA97959.1 hypothetical protein E5Q_04639 [Mixia osmundae IAM 14324]
MVSFSGGSLSGPRIQGRLLPGGANWLTSSNDLAVGTRTFLLDTRDVIETDDGAIICQQINGVRIGQSDVLDLLSTDASIPAAVLIATAGRTISPSGQDVVIYDANLVT